MALRWGPLLLCVAWLTYVGLGGLAPVVSGAIRWASARTRPVLTTAAAAYLAWISRGQAQRLWMGALTFIRRNAPRKCPATSTDYQPIELGNLGGRQDNQACESSTPHCVKGGCQNHS